MPVSLESRHPSAPVVASTMPTGPAPVATAAPPAPTGDRATISAPPKAKSFVDEVRIGFSHSWFLTDMTAPPAKSGWVSRNGVRVEAAHTLLAGERAALKATASLTADKGHLSYLVVPAVGLRGQVKAFGPLSVYGSASVGMTMGQLVGKPALGPQVHVAGGAAVKAVFVEYGIDRGPGLTGQTIAAGVRLQF